MICRKVVGREDGECGMRAIYTGEVHNLPDFVAVTVRCPEGHESLFYSRKADRRASGVLVGERQGG